MDLKDSVQYIKGVGPKKAQILSRMGIDNIYDLLTYYPYRYQDQSSITDIADLEVGTVANVAGTVAAVRDKSSRRGMKMLIVLVRDNTGVIQVTWFNQQYLKNKLKPGTAIFLHGKITYAYGGQGQLAMQVMNYDLGSENSAGLNPVYSIPDFMKPKDFKKLIDSVLAEELEFPEILPEGLRKKYNLLPKHMALSYIHNPQNSAQLQQARDSLIYEELFAIQAGLLYWKYRNQVKQQGIKFRASGALVEQVFKALPFTLTGEQQKVWQDIQGDMERSEQMQRLVQGDVGSGKTVIAILALVKAVENGYQGAMMAPTEILAIQHYEKISELLEPLGIKVVLLTGSVKTKQRRLILEDLKNGLVDILIGTHALIQEAVEYNNLGLVITDEQHRFGVRQRAELENKAGEKLPDVLVMTATPIPRTMTLTVYGDLDVSFIKELPPGRKPIRTFLRNMGRRELIYKFVYDQVQAGRQAYVVCPLIEESESIDTASVEHVYEELTGGYLYGLNCGLLHGKLKPQEKEDLLHDFLDGKIQVLISTTVIEVGVNVPNASVMVIEGAERFGLAQLHQLRGRIGRGEYASYCILINRGKGENAVERLRLMEAVADGFVLAEEDLKLRGPGQFFGNQQHGLPDLKIADVLKDLELLVQARKDAEQYLEFGIPSNKLNLLLELQYKDKFLNIADV